MIFVLSRYMDPKNRKICSLFYTTARRHDVMKKTFEKKHRILLYEIPGIEYLTPNGSVQGHRTARIASHCTLGCDVVYYQVLDGFDIIRRWSVKVCNNLDASHRYRLLLFSQVFPTGTSYWYFLLVLVLPLLSYQYIPVQRQPNRAG